MGCRVILDAAPDLADLIQWRLKLREQKQSEWNDDNPSTGALPCRAARSRSIPRSTPPGAYLKEHPVAAEVEGRRARNRPRWCVYILRCRDGSLYTGCTNALARRLERHCAGKGARYTRSRLPVILVYEEPVRNKGAALRREAALKGLTRAEKLALVAAATRARPGLISRQPGDRHGHAAPRQTAQPRSTSRRRRSRQRDAP